MLTRLKKFNQLSRQDKKTFADAWLIFVKFDLLISWIPYEKWRHQLTITAEDHTTENMATNPIDYKDGASDKLLISHQLNEIKHIIHLSELAGRSHVRKMNCLRRCLTQQQLLKKQGLSSHMHIGVALNNGQLSAHSWLTFQGIVINDTNDVNERYSALKAMNEKEILHAMK